MEREDILLTMQWDLAKAMQKPPEKRRWEMLIDTRKCVGCRRLHHRLVAEYKLPPGVVYRPVIDQVNGKFPDVKRQFMPRPCYQCKKPVMRSSLSGWRHQEGSRRHC